MATIKFIGGDKYKGEVFRGDPHGKGIMYFANGDRYEGEFAQGVRQGKGT